MSKHSRYIPNGGAATATNPARKPGQPISSPVSAKPERTADPSAQAREETRGAKPQEADKAPAKAKSSEPLRAAKGDDDVMSQEPRKS